MSTNQIIVTAVGKDRPGIVADLSKLVHDSGASIADSRMVNMRGQFALLAMIEGSKESLAQLDEALARAKKSLGLALTISPAAAEGDTKAAVGSGIPYRLRTYSADQPGIVARVTSVLSRHGVNVEDLSTRVESAPFAGTPLFTMDAKVLVPAATSIRKLRGELDEVGDSIPCDIDLDPL